MTLQARKGALSALLFLAVLVLSAKLVFAAAPTTGTAPGTGALSGSQGTAEKTPVTPTPVTTPPTDETGTQVPGVSPQVSTPPAPKAPSPFEQQVAVAAYQLLLDYVKATDQTSNSWAATWAKVSGPVATFIGLSITALTIGVLAVYIFVFALHWLLRRLRDGKWSSELFGTYSGSLHSLFHLLFTAALLSIAGMVLSAVVTLALQAAHKPVLLGLSPEQLQLVAKAETTGSSEAGTQAEQIMQLAEVMFGFFGLVLAAISAAVGAGFWWAKRRLSDALTKMDQIEELRDTVQQNCLISADLALLTLPEILYTHQIPEDLTHVLQSLDDILAAEPSLWEKLEETPNGARICYARGLYHLAAHPKSRDAVEYLTKALRKAEKGHGSVRLRRGILVRLVQAYRQLNRFKEARRTLDQLEKYAEQLKDNGKTRLICRWEEAIYYLQQGLLVQKNGKDERVKHLAESARLMQSIYNEARDGQDTLPWLHCGLPTPNLAYYTAKSHWSLVLALDKGLHGVEEHGFSKEVFENTLIHSLNEGIRLFEKVANSESQGDPYVDAIYNFCCAFMKLIKNNLYGNGLKSEPTFATEMQNHLRSVNRLFNSVDKQEQYIYSESTERLESPTYFLSDVNILLKPIDLIPDSVAAMNTLQTQKLEFADKKVLTRLYREGRPERIVDLWKN